MEYNQKGNSSNPHSEDHYQYQDYNQYYTPDGIPIYNNEQVQPTLPGQYTNSPPQNINNSNDGNIVGNYGPIHGEINQYPSNYPEAIPNRI